ncbi:MAG: SusC/RagA family TonB-linked outer membrane protein, partial [Pedobacter sp.]
MQVVLKGRGVEWLIKEKYIVLEKKSPALKTPIESGPLKAQGEKRQEQVKGRVIDETGSGIPGVGVKIKGTAQATLTDENGLYAITAPKGSILVFSYVGFAAQEIQVTDQLNINVSLKAEDSNLNEVIVVGYGTQKKVNLTGAVSQVSGKDLAARPMGQTSAALQGMAPGVTVKQSSGRPGGDGGSIRIRGIGTLSDANPLVMIDGIEGSMNNIDPNLIESISVLKDAASSSIYGSRAANGVILITTKRAKA